MIGIYELIDKFLNSLHDGKLSGFFWNRLLKLTSSIVITLGKQNRVRSPSSMNVLIKLDLGRSILVLKILLLYSNASFP